MALQKLLVEGNYFSDEQLEERDPELYQHYIGRFQPSSRLGREYEAMIGEVSEVYVILTVPRVQYYLSIENDFSC